MKCIFKRDSYVPYSIINNSQDMNQPRCPYVDKEIKKIWYVYPREYYSAIYRRNSCHFTDNMDEPGRH